jgi:hypothetical protein
MLPRRDRAVPKVGVSLEDFVADDDVADVQGNRATGENEEVSAETAQASALNAMRAHRDRAM